MTSTSGKKKIEKKGLHRSSEGKKVISFKIKINETFWPSKMNTETWYIYYL